MKSARLSRSLASVLLVMLMTLLSGCATIGQIRGGPGQKLDPWENWNRKVFAFNEALDSAVLIPVSTAYNKVVPSLVRTGVSNFFGNFSDAWSGVNNLLQGLDDDKSTVSLDDIESLLLRKAVDRAQGNVAAAARLLGITRPQMVYRLKSRGITHLGE